MRRLLSSVVSLARRQEIFPGRPTEGTALAVIGDVHGYADHFSRIMEEIDARFAELSPDRRVVVQVGDLIDRGPDSAGCLDIAIRQKTRDDIDFVALLGNHEIFLKICLRSDEECQEHVTDWLAFGGRQTVDSLLPDMLCPPLSEIMAHPGRFRRDLHEALKGARLDLLNDLESHYLNGSILISHAGFTGNFPAEEILDLDWDASSPEHWAWTRAAGDGGVTCEGLHCSIVHGHTIHAEARPAGARFPVDTGVYRSGRLSAAIFYEDGYEIVEVTE